MATQSENEQNYNQAYTGGQDLYRGEIQPHASQQQSLFPDAESQERARKDKKHKKEKKHHKHKSHKKSRKHHRHSEDSDGDGNGGDDSYDSHDKAKKHRKKEHKHKKHHKRSHRRDDSGSQRSRSRSRSNSGSPRLGHKRADGFSSQANPGISMGTDKLNKMQSNFSMGPEPHLMGGTSQSME